MLIHINYVNLIRVEDTANVFNKYVCIKLTYLI